MEVKLVVANGKLAGKVIPVAGPKFRIGRGETCQLRPQSNSVSRKHCVIRVEPGSATIEDYGSTNGTYVNNEKILQRQELKNGDVIRVGLLELQVELVVGVGGKKKPAVRSVQEAAARTVASSASAKDDVFDISGWLAEDTPAKAVPAKKEPATGDTLSGTSLIETTTIPTSPDAPKKPEEKKSSGSPKNVGKLQRTTKPIGDNSGQAAAEVLRQFFQRKKP